LATVEINSDGIPTIGSVEFPGFMTAAGVACRSKAEIFEYSNNVSVRKWRVMRHDAVREELYSG